MGSRGAVNRFHRERDPWDNPHGLIACRYAVIVGVTGGGLVVLGLSPGDMPDPVAPVGAQLELAT